MDTSDTYQGVPLSIDQLTKNKILMYDEERLNKQQTKL